jgi:hypothetical protein
MEVILDVVFNHTAEGSEQGLTLTFRCASRPVGLPAGRPPGRSAIRTTTQQRKAASSRGALLAWKGMRGGALLLLLSLLRSVRRGLDNRVYYMLAPEGQCYNYSGCGNTFNCGHPVARQFIVDCLRYWVQEMHVDGFRRVQASATALPSLVPQQCLLSLSGAGRLPGGDVLPTTQLLVDSHRLPGVVYPKYYAVRAGLTSGPS